MMKFLKITCWCAPLLLLFAFLSLLVPSTAHADGGAPNLAYVSGTGNGVSVVDVMQQKVTSTIAVPGGPREVALSLDGRFLYVAQPQLGHVVAIAAKTGSSFCTANVGGQPTLLTLDTNNNTLFAGGSGSNSVSVIDATNCAVKRTLHVEGPVYGLAFAAVGTTGSTSDQVWVSSTNTLTVFDDVTGRQLAQVPVAAGPRYLSIPPGAMVYVTTQQGSIVAVDLNTHTVTPLISGGDYGPMDYDQGTGEIYVPDRKNDQIVVLAPVDSGFALPTEPSRVLHFSTAPMSVAITSDGQLGFVALTGGSVAMLDIPGHGQVITTINVGGNPSFIITGLYPPSLGTTPQQASILETLITIAAYTIVAALLIVPLVLFWRYTRPRRKAKALEQGAEQTEQSDERPASDKPGGITR